MRRRLHPLLLVTGSRECDYDPVVSVLDDTLEEIISSYGPPFLMHGKARGTDQIAHMWGTERAVERKVAWVESFPAHWAVYGQGAGPIRNAAMGERIWPHQEVGGIVIVHPRLRAGADHMTDMPDFDEPLMAFTKRLHAAEFSPDEIAEAAGALGEFAGEALNIIQKHVHDMIDRFGLATIGKYGHLAEMDEWYRGFLSGVGMSLNVVLYGDGYINELLRLDAIPKIRAGMDALLGKEGASLPPEVLALVDMLREGHEPSDDMVRAATQAWIGL